MSEIEPPESFAVDRLGVPEDCRRLAGSLIEARDNAVRAALLEEYIAHVNQLALAEQMTIGRLGCYRRAFDLLKAKYSQPKEPTSG